MVSYALAIDTEVKMESYIDDQATNLWRQVSSVNDNGSCYASSCDQEFCSINSSKAKFTLSQTHSGPIATSRSDAIV
jgi:hypothetical protein